MRKDPEQNDIPQISKAQAVRFVLDRLRRADGNQTQLAALGPEISKSLPACSLFPDRLARWEKDRNLRLNLYRSYPEALTPMVAAGQAPDLCAALPEVGWNKPENDALDDLLSVSRRLDPQVKTASENIVNQYRRASPEAAVTSLAALAFPAYEIDRLVEETPVIAQQADLWRRRAMIFGVTSSLLFIGNVLVVIL